jgi:hypothetical protein
MVSSTASAATDCGPDNDHCCICLDSLHTELGRQRLPCGHVMHGSASPTSGVVVPLDVALCASSAMWTSHPCKSSLTAQSGTMPGKSSTNMLPSWARFSIGGRGGGALEYFDKLPNARLDTIDDAFVYIKDHKGPCGDGKTSDTRCRSQVGPGQNAEQLMGTLNTFLDREAGFQQKNQCKRNCGRRRRRRRPRRERIKGFRDQTLLSERMIIYLYICIYNIYTYIYIAVLV